MSKLILCFGILVSVTIRGLLITNSSEVADIKLLRQMGEAVLKNINPYDTLSYNVYPPIGIFIEAATLYLSNMINIPFNLLTRVWPNIADVIISLILFKILTKLKIKPILAAIWSMVFLLNPISILISSSHGQIDSIPSLLVLLSIYLTFPFTRSYRLLSALILGLAIAIKPNPLMLLPLFLLAIKSNLKQKITFAITCMTPLVVSFLPYVLQNPGMIFPNILNYSGVYDFGYAAIMRGFWFQRNANIWLPNSSEFLTVSKVLFLIGLILIFLLFSKSNNLVKGCLSAYVLFLGLYFGISAQYLSWILPFAVLERDKMVLPFSLFGTLSLFGFYMFFGPDILLGKSSTAAAFQSKYMPIYVIGNFSLWITVLWWIIKLVKSQIILKKRL